MLTLDKKQHPFFSFIDFSISIHSGIYWVLEKVLKETEDIIMVMGSSNSLCSRRKKEYQDDPFCSDLGPPGRK
jgi:hypothetical protein